MNTRFLHKLASLLCLLPLWLLTQSTAHAQTNERAQGNIVTILQQYKCDIQIENGELLTAPLKDRVDVKALWGPGDIHGVPATVGNLAKYLRAADINLNIVLSPGAGDVTIGDLKIRSGDMKAVTEAVTIATENKVRGSQLSGKDTWTFMVQQKHNPGKTVEVFNLSGYIQTLNTNDSDLINRKLDELKELIWETLKSSGYTSVDDTSFRYHPGTHLLIVTGSTDAIDVTRKIVNALSGQPRPDVREDLLDISTNRNQN